MPVQKISAGIYIDGSDPVRESGELTIHGRCLTFTNENREVSFSTSNIEVTFGGTAKRVAYLKDKMQGHMTLHVTDFDLFKHEAFKKHASAKGAVKERKKHHFALIFSFVALALAVLVPSYFVFVERTIVAGFIAKNVPYETEKSLGDQIFNLQFAGGSAMVDDPEIMAEFNTLIAPLLSVAEKGEYDFQVHLMKSPEANAFAMPGGHIVVLTGLIEKSDYPEELLGVLAHEMAHVTQRHSLKQIISDLSGRILFSILASGMSDLVYTIGDQGRYLLAQKYSRAQEEEADEYGFDYLLQAGISPAGLIEFFEKLKEDDMLDGIEIANLLSTHPASEKRIENLRAMMQQYKGEYAPIDFPYEDLKQKISDLED